MTISAPAILLLVVVGLLGGIVWGLVQKQWVLVAGCAAVLLAGAVWIVMLLWSLHSTYRYAGTRQSLKEIADDLCRYHEQHGAFPPGFKISDLGNPRLAGPEDGWRYVPDITPHAFTLTSGARDGKPGGTGYDQDIIVSWKVGDGLNIQSADISP
jgi:hypothetical protein